MHRTRKHGALCHDTLGIDHAGMAANQCSDYQAGSAIPDAGAGAQPAPSRTAPWKFQAYSSHEIRTAGLNMLRAANTQPTTSITQLTGRATEVANRA